jgi:hypothetical protein
VQNSSAKEEKLHQLRRLTVHLTRDETQQGKVLYTLNKHHTMETEGEVKIQLHAF